MFKQFLTALNYKFAWNVALHSSNILCTEQEKMQT
jgi:hypothetical protein